MPKDQRPPPRERDSIWSVARGWLPWYLLLVFTLLFSWAALVAWGEITHGDYPARNLLIQGSVIKISGGIIAIVIFSLAAVTIADTGGGALVVTYRYLNNKFVEPLRRQLRQEGREEGREEGLEQGLEQGVEQGFEQGLEQGVEQGIARGREEGIEQGFERGREQGIEQGREQGIAQGREQGREQGIAQGREQGREQGIEQGREQGMAEGREQGIEQGREQGMAQGREQGMAQGREQVLELKNRTLEWYVRQQQALAKGEPFDEPPPFFSSANGHEPNGK